MKFNEKLIALRKKEGLSQEELGYKLNVTRQTVSKWELGQTTPEMDKLAEMSKIFNVSVDELINDSEERKDINMDPINNKIEDQPIQEKKSKNNKAIYIVFIILIAIFIYFVGQIILGSLGISLFKKAAGDIFDMQGNLVNQAFDNAGGIYNNAMNIIEDDSNQNNSGEAVNEFLDNFWQTATNITNGDLDNKISETKDQVSKQSFNGHIELYAGTKKSLHAVTVLDNIITSNKTNDRKITVKYDKTETQDEAEIRVIKQTINKADMLQDFEIICEYDAQGYIYKVIIEKV